MSVTSPSSNVAWKFLPRLNVALISLLTNVFNVRQRIVSFEFLVSMWSNIDWRVATLRKRKRKALRACQVISAASKHSKINKIHFNSVFFSTIVDTRMCRSISIRRNGSVEISLSLIDCTVTRRFGFNNSRVIEIISDRQKLLGFTMRLFCFSGRYHGRHAHQ